MPAPVELVRIDDGGSSFIVRILGRYGPGVPQSHDWLEAEMLVESAFISGSVAQIFVPEDLREWEAALDPLAAGEPVSWMAESGRTPEVRMRLVVTEHFSYVEVELEDAPGSRTTARLAIDVEAGWIDDLRRGLDAVRVAFPEETIETSPNVYTWRDR